MKTVFFALLMFLQIMVVAQIAKPVTNAELKALVGTWTGTLVATGFVDGKNQHTYTTALEVVDMQDSLMFNFTFTGEEGKQLIEKYPLRIYDNGDKLSFDSTQFEITDIRRRGINIGPGILNITKGIRYPDMIDFSIQKRLILTKK